MKIVFFTPWGNRYSPILLCLIKHKYSIKVGRDRSYDYCNYRNDKRIRGKKNVVN